MDRRQKRTRFAILEAFSELLAKKSFSAISVQEIIDVADVGRTTFYAHFETKEFLLKELCEELFCHIIDSTLEHPNDHTHYFDCRSQDSIFLHLIRHLQSGDTPIMRLLTSENDGIFKSYFKESLRRMVESLYNDGLAKNCQGLPAGFAVNHVAATFVETVGWWLGEGRLTSPEKVHEYFLKAVEPVFVLEKQTERAK